MLKHPGSINCRACSLFIYKGKEYIFDATTKGLAEKLSNLGAKPGQGVQANYGGMSKEGLERYIITYSPHETRNKSGLWVDRA